MVEKAGQFEQDFEAAVVEYKPTGHAMQSLVMFANSLAALKVPAGHGKHSSAKVFAA